MPVLVRFKPDNMTVEQYDEVDAKLEAEGHWPPDGLMLHVCFGDEGHLLVSEVWESREKQDAFSAQLMPVLEESGIDVRSNPPEFLDVHSIEVPQEIHAHA